MRRYRDAVMSRKPSFFYSTPPATMLIPVPLTGPVPTMMCRKVTWTAQCQRTFHVTRFLVTECVGKLLASSIKIGNEEQLASDIPLDLQLIGNPNAFMTRLVFPPVEAGMLFRVEIEWVPPPMTILMSRKELAKRRREQNWSVSWKGVRLRIEGDRAVDTLVPRSKRYGVHGFVSWPQPVPKIMLLAKTELLGDGNEDRNQTKQ